MSAGAEQTQASDFVRVYFHAITGWELPVTGCQTCWEEVIFLFNSMTTPAEILASPHECTADWNCSQILAQELTDHPEKW